MVIWAKVLSLTAQKSCFANLTRKWLLACYHLALSSITFPCCRATLPNAPTSNCCQQMVQATFSFNPHGPKLEGPSSYKHIIYICKSYMYFLHYRYNIYNIMPHVLLIQVKTENTPQFIEYTLEDEDCVCQFSISCSFQYKRMSLSILTEKSTSEAKWQKTRNVHDTDFCFIFPCWT